MHLIHPSESIPSPASSSRSARSVTGFAMLSACDAAARGILLSVFPLAMYRALGDAGLVSSSYLLVGGTTVVFLLLIPWFLKFIPRRAMFSIGALLYTAAGLIASLGGADAVPFALPLYTAAAVTVFTCLNAYVLDSVSHADLSRCESLRIFYAALSWTVGPALGVWLEGLWRPAPFLLSGVFGLTLLAVFWWLRMGNGRVIRRARRQPQMPLAFLGRFLAQPRLVAGWSFAVIRSCGWWVYVVYLPIFAVEHDLGAETAGIALSLTNGMLFSSPFIARWVRRRSVRVAVRTGFAGSALFFVLGAVLPGWPWATVGALFVASFFLILLDICAGLPFLMAVKPSERSEMSAIYSSFRDVSGMLSPAAAWVVLLFAPVSATFALAGAGLACAWVVAASIHPRLGAGPKLPAAPPPLPPAVTA